MPRNTNQRKRRRVDATATDATAEEPVRVGLRRSKRLREKRERESKSQSVSSDADEESEEESERESSMEQPSPPSVRVRPPRMRVHRQRRSSRLSSIISLSSPPRTRTIDLSTSDDNESRPGLRRRRLNRHNADVSNRRQRRRQVSYGRTTIINDGNHHATSQSSSSSSASRSDTSLHQESEGSGSSSSSLLISDDGSSKSSSMTVIPKVNKLNEQGELVETRLILSEATTVMNYWQSFKEYLSCLICTELMAAPITLDCGHSFCYTCLIQWIEQHDCDNPEHDHHADCPTCRKRISYGRLKPKPRHGCSNSSSASSASSSSSSTSVVAGAAAGRLGYFPRYGNPSQSRPRLLATMQSRRSGPDYGVSRAGNSHSTSSSSTSTMVLPSQSDSGVTQQEYESDILDELRMSITLSQILDGLIHLEGLFTASERESYQRRLNEYERMVARLRNDEKRREYELKMRQGEMDRRDSDRYASMNPFFGDIMAGPIQRGVRGATERAIYAVLHQHIQMHGDDDDDEEDESDLNDDFGASGIRLSTANNNSNNSRSRVRRSATGSSATTTANRRRTSLPRTRDPFEAARLSAAASTSRSSGRSGNSSGVRSTTQSQSQSSRHRSSSEGGYNLRSRANRA